MDSRVVTDELTEMNSLTLLYDTLQPIIKEKVKNPTTFNKFLKVFRDFATKNDRKLNTNIIGRQIVISSKMEDDALDAFGVTKADIKEVIKNSQYFKNFGKELALTDQLCFAIPLILAALEYYRLGKKEESNLIYLFIFFKPYSSRESVFFKYGVNESQMLYTIEKDLTDRFDLKKSKTIFLSIKKKAENSFENYIPDYGKDKKITDKDLHIIYTSGIATRMNHFLGAVVELYKKNAGKNLEFENSAAGVYDKDEDATEFEDSDIQSDAAIKTKVISRSINKVTKDPVDRSLINLACQNGFGSSGKYYTQILSAAVEEITDKMFKDLQPFFSALIGSFLYHKDPTSGRLYTMADFKTPIFLNVGIDILAGKKSHLKDTNMITAREIMSRMLEDYSEQYRAYEETFKRNMRKALAAYWVFLIKSAN